MSPTLTRRALLLALLAAPLSAAAKPKAKRKPRPTRVQLTGEPAQRARARRALVQLIFTNYAWGKDFKGRFISTSGELRVLKRLDDPSGELLGSIAAAQVNELRRLIASCAAGKLVEHPGDLDAGTSIYSGFIYDGAAIAEVTLGAHGDLRLTNQAPEAAQLIERFHAHFAAAGQPSSAPHKDAPLISPW